MMKKSKKNNEREERDEEYEGKVEILLRHTTTAWWLRGMRTRLEDELRRRLRE